MKRFRIRNPSPTQWALLATSGALVLGIGTAAYAGYRRRSGLPGVKEDPTPETPEVPDVPTEAPTQWGVISSDQPGYPWEFPVLHYNNYPTPGTWFNAGDKSGAFEPSKGFDAMVRAALGSALAMAGNDFSIAGAQGQDPNASLGRKLRSQLRKAIIAIGGVNDLTYGQTNLNFAGGNDPDMPGGDKNKPVSGDYVLNDQGRGLNWLPRHADNLERIQAGLPLRRTTSMQGQKLSSPNSGNQQMLIWIPAVSLVALGPDRAVPTIEFLSWSDGSSTLDPPPQIQDLGVDLSGVIVPT